ncbi:MAG: hypothetical protein BGO40_06870 [Chryseobacterium sp. 39-10]|nr:helix-turn-helix domain-containing protein [Chryseobacterium sp.]OJV48004.1 MAG: hypothetical protein BGO40_06870 [Chryseobacterium sp. 39-10]
MASKTKILLHKDELKAAGMDILALKGLSFVDQELHRDDHYMFILLKSGHFVCEVDFNRIEIQHTALLYAAPGQVQHYLKAENCEGWLLFANPDFVSQPLREFFDSVLNVSQSVEVAENNPVFATSDILGAWWSTDSSDDDLSDSVSTSLLDSIIGMMALALKGTSIQNHHSNSSKYVLANRLKQLIKEQFREMKQVKQYALLLHITPLYLNEVMKEITGFSASYWIHHEILLEAKRLLAFSEKDVRQIAWDLGYEDDAYFSRFFKKHTGSTASAFRKQKP